MHRFLFIIAVTLAHISCASRPTTLTPTRPTLSTKNVETLARVESRLVLWYVPGISGQRPLDDRFLVALADAIQTQSTSITTTRITNWSGANAGLNSLLNYPRARQQALLLASELQEYASANPNDRLVLLCHSAGAGVTAWALEAMPPDVRISTWVMLAPALSPSYDLTSALGRVAKAYVFSSELDSIVLGTGTRLLGTIDRVQSDAAGRIGFTRAYPNLDELKYDKSWMAFNNDGDHIGPMMPGFARGVIAPLITAHTPSTINGDAISN